MSRRTKPEKPLIYVFCEGESEQAYADYLKKIFSCVVSIKRMPKTGLYDYAKRCYAKDASLRSNAAVTDEIWFFYDVEAADADKWEQRLKIINSLRKMRKKPNIKIRLLITTCCIEYWLMLHYKKYAPKIITKADKERVKADLIRRESTYKKGDYSSTARIAAKYPEAVKNAQSVLHDLLSKGMPCMEDTDERNHWLSVEGVTFSTVHEAIVFLMQKQEAARVK